MRPPPPDSARAAPRVGIFDSGVGGLTVWREIVRRWPELETIYLADQAHVPYGPRPAVEIAFYARGISRFLAGEGCRTIVLACNTASAAALAPLRDEFPGTAFVGMEPAVKPAAQASEQRVVGILATPATFQGALFATTLERFASDVRVIRQVCPGLVEQIEVGILDGDATESLLRSCLAPSLAAGADSIVLACTHYPFVRPLIERLVGPRVAVIDPAPAIAVQVGRVTGLLDPAGAVEPSGAAKAPDDAPAQFLTTGDPARFERVAGALLGLEIRARTLSWRADGTLVPAAPETPPAR